MHNLMQHINLQIRDKHCAIYTKHTQIQYNKGNMECKPALDDKCGLGIETLSTCS